MTTAPVVLEATASAGQAAIAMRDHGVGDVLVRHNGNLCGIVTDRDLVVRVLADHDDPNAIRLGDIASKDLTCVTADTTTGEAVRLMREKALRRLPVIDNGEPCGVISLGDLAVEHDDRSALAEISAAPSNH